MVEIDADVLDKSGPLTPQDIEKLRRHPSRSVEIIKPFLSADEFGRAIRHHHERYDGTGYPEGLAGEAIPLSARILAVIDAYESMTSDRPWRRALRPAQAANELFAHSGTQFDRRVVEAFLDVLAENAEIGRTEYLDARKEDQECLQPLSS
jgi:polar amino acid transport system substrate-binding protein